MLSSTVPATAGWQGAGDVGALSEARFDAVVEAAGMLFARSLKPLEGSRPWLRGRGPYGDRPANASRQANRLMETQQVHSGGEAEGVTEFPFLARNDDV